ncbi:MAG: hypothetical protein V4597_14600 [Pseudomonadota bacterium]
MITTPDRIQRLASEVEQDLARLATVKADEDKVARALAEAIADHDAKVRAAQGSEKALADIRDLMAKTTADRIRLDREVKCGQFMLTQAHTQFGPFEPPTGEAIADSITRGTIGTLAFPAIRAARPVSGDNGAVVCGQPECGLELVQQDGTYIHTSTGTHTCNAEAAPALQEGTDGDPTRRTVLPPHIAAEVRADG